MRFLPIVFVLLATALQGANPTFKKSVDTIADLKSLLVTDKHDTVFVRGYSSANDGGQGSFEFNPLSTAVADGGIRHAPNIGGGRWERVLQGREFIARWWGPTKTNLTLQSAMNWVSSNGWGRVIVDGGTWTVKSDDATRILMQTGVTLSTADDSQIVCAPDPTNNWILIDFPLDVHDCAVGPARLVGWDLTAPGGDTNKSGLIFSMQDTVNVTIGGVKASNWYTRYADVGSGNINLQLFDENWERSIKALGAKVDGVTDDTRAVQDSVYYAERYTRVVEYPLGTNITLQTSVWVTNGVPITIKGNNSKIHVFYSQPGDVTNARYSGAFIFGSSADNCTVDGLHFKQISVAGEYFTNREEVTTSGTYAPLIINLATNIVVKNCTFDFPTGRGILSSGSYMDIHNNKFLNGCGISFGVGQPHNWLFFENTVPLGADQIYLSPIGVRVTDNLFTGSNAWKHIVFFSAANKFTFSRNKMVDIWTPIGAVTCYSGDLGTTDSLGTNVYEFGGMISENTITGTFGSQGAIRVTLITPTNFVATIDPSFNVDGMYSTVVAKDNNIAGTGDGYQLVDARGTRIVGGDCRVTGDNLRIYGNAENVEVDAGFYSTDGNGALGTSIIFGTAFLAPGHFKGVKFRNSTFVVGANAEHWMRTVSDPIDSLLVENCDIYFLGAAGSGDAPSVFLFAASPTNFIKFDNNRFYLTNSMSGRSLGSIIGTNCDVTLLNNELIALSDTVKMRGPQVAGRRVELKGNVFGAVDIVADRLIMSKNTLTYRDGLLPLTVTSARAASITDNLIEHQNTNSSVAVNISATNVTFANNIVIGNSGSDIVMSLLGKMYIHNNVVLNSGSGFTFPTAAGTGTISDDIYEHPLHVDSGSDPRRMLEFRRTGTIGILGVNPDNGDAMFESWATISNSVNGFRFRTHHNNTPTNQFFETLGITQGRVSLGTSTNEVEVLIFGLTNALLRTDSFGIIKTTVIGANLTWDGTTLASTGGGGGTVPTGTGFTHVTSGAQDAAAKLIDTADINNLQVTSAKIASGVDAAKIGGGVVNTTEFDFLGTITSDVQTQINARISATSTDTLTGKTIDAASAGNVLKFKNYLKFNFARRVDGVGCTIPNTNDFTLPTFMVPRFSGTTVSNNNFCRFAVRVPTDFDTAVVPQASLSVRLTAADTAAHTYNVGFASVANSAISTATVGTWIALTVAADASGASDDVEGVSNVSLTGWNSGLTPDQWWVIELNRAGAADASTVASELLELQIEYSATQ